MHNLIIVEDEIIIRVWIEKNIDWKEMGIKNTGRFGDGLDTFRFIKWIGVHIALVDIRMTKMDCLELMRQYRMLKMKTNFIFLSMFDSFQYTQTAINCSAKGYLHKPLKKHKINEIIMNVLYELNMKNKIKKPAVDEPYNIEKALSGILSFMKKAITYINENFDKKFTLESIGKILYVSPAYFGIAFKKSTGMSFVDYLINVKINKVHAGKWVVFHHLYVDIDVEYNQFV